MKKKIYISQIWKIQNYSLNSLLQSKRLFAHVCTLYMLCKNVKCTYTLIRQLHPRLLTKMRLQQRQ